MIASQKNHHRKYKADNDCGERLIKPSANGGGTASGAKLAPDAEYIRFPYYFARIESKQWLALTAR